MATSLELTPQPLIPEYTEQNVSMVQQYAQARIQSAYSVADSRPRKIEVIRQGVLRECSRPSFCVPDEGKNGSSLAIYRVPRGKIQDANGKWVDNNISGPTIRFAEMLLREWKYLSIEVNPMGEDDKQRLLQVICTDYQSCNFTSEIVVVPKTLERKKLRPSDIAISQRTNTYGDPVYLVQADDSELAMKTNALVSKARRNLILQAVPGWLIEEGIEKVRETARTRDAADPDAAKRKLFDAFATVGVSAAQLIEYLGHSNELSPAELEDLRGYFSGIREGFTTWASVMAAKEENGAEDGTEATLKALFEQLEMTNAQIRNIKGKYVGRAKELVAYLTEQVAKRAHTGARAEEKKPEPTKRQAAAENPDAEPTTSDSEDEAYAKYKAKEAKDAQDAKKQEPQPGPVPVQQRQPAPQPTPASESNFASW